MKLLAVLAIFFLVGIASATTLTLNATHSGSSMEGSNNTFSIQRGDVGDYSSDGTVYLQFSSSSTTNIYDVMRRGMVTWNTSSVPDTATINSATVTLYGTSNSSNWATVSAIAIVDCYPVSDTDYANGDYDGTTYTRQASTDLAYASLRISNLSNNWTLTNTTYINKTGNTSYMFLTSWEASNSPSTWVATNIFTALFVTYTSSDYPPQLTIDYTVSGGAGNTSFDATPLIGSAPLTVQFNDTSDNGVISAYAWYFSNVTVTTDTLFSTSEDPSYAFPVGVYDIKHSTIGNVTAWSNKTAYIRVGHSPIAHFNQTVVV